jgi:hypothetical protein
MKRRIILSIFIVFLFCQYSQAAFLDVLKDTLNTVSPTKTSDGKIDLGLKEALNVGVKNSINYLGKNNGYFANQAVKILLPVEIQKAEKVLRGVGFGPQLDEFTLSMNRAAEKAAPLAADIFSNAITDCEAATPPQQIILRVKPITSCLRFLNPRFAKPWASIR